MWASRKEESRRLDGKEDERRCLEREGVSKGERQFVHNAEKRGCTMQTEMVRGGQLTWKSQT